MPAHLSEKSQGILEFIRNNPAERNYIIARRFDASYTCVSRLRKRLGLIQPARRTVFSFPPERRPIAQIGKQNQATDEELFRQKIREVWEMGGLNA